MDKNYQKITIWGDIDSAVAELLRHKEQNILACADFNGVILYSNTVTIESAYKDILEKSKEEFVKERKEFQDNYDRELQEHKNNIPKLSEEWKERGRKILTEDVWDLWDKIVPVRLSDLYQGMELRCTLEIAEILNNNGSFEDAKTRLENQNHSGMSWGLMMGMISAFCIKGKEFVEYAR